VAYIVARCRALAADFTLCHGTSHRFQKDKLRRSGKRDFRVGKPV
jgi:hypothetical protein